jgi:serine/threonine protein phosphatase PrpC
MLFLNRDMDRVELHELPGGVAAVFSLGDRGRAGPNQDSAAVLPVDESCAVLAVADGVGGNPDGATASSTALTALREAVDDAIAGRSGVRNAILTGFENANRAVAALGTGGGTTLAVAKVEAGRLRPFHVGDSAVAVFGQRGRRKLETLSHSPVGYAVEAGLLDENEAMHHEERHLISNVVGSDTMRIEIGPPVDLAARDTVLLATDGLLDNLFMEEIVDLARAGPLDRCAQRVADLCLARMKGGEDGKPSKPDDLTFVVFRPR